MRLCRISLEVLQGVVEIIRKIHKGGATILLVGQNAAVALEVADGGFVLATGTVVAKGTGSDLLHDDAVR
jgi:branched-chain amino acid transport system ATP-binding protein